MRRADDPGGERPGDGLVHQERVDERSPPVPRGTRGSPPSRGRRRRSRGRPGARRRRSDACRSRCRRADRPGSLPSRHDDGERARREEAEVDVLLSAVPVGDARRELLVDEDAAARVLFGIDRDSREAQAGVPRDDRAAGFMKSDETTEPQRTLPRQITGSGARKGATPDQPADLSGSSPLPVPCRREPAPPECPGAPRPAPLRDPNARFRSGFPRGGSRPSGSSRTRSDPASPPIVFLHDASRAPSPSGATSPNGSAGR